MPSAKQIEMIAANIVDPSTGAPVFGKEFAVITLEGGLRVAVTGVLDEKIKFPAYIDRSTFTVKPAEATLKKIIPAMKREADFKLITNVFATRQNCALAMGLDPSDWQLGLSLEYARRENNPINPQTVERENAPVKEVPVNLIGFPGTRH